jgi:RNA polymerase sigma-70 factor (ECF subfamily)
MLGSLSEAEDIVQEAWLRWARKAERVAIPGAYLTRIVTRLCLDQLKSARARRESYIGAWLPEPLMDISEADETIADDVTLTLMLAMERLSPLERAAFLLHDVFDMPLSDVAMTLGREPAAVRQLASRARKHVQHARPRFTLEAAEADRIARAFFVAARDGDAAALSALLARDVEIHSDGGGKVIAFLNVVRGIDRALRLFVGLRRKYKTAPRLVRTATINGLPGYVGVDRGNVLQTTALDVRDGRIAAIYIVRNPDKLRHLAAAFGTSDC